MAAPSKSKWIILVIALVLIAGGASIALLQSSREQTVLDFIETIPGNLKAENVEVGLFDGKITVHGLKGDLTLFEEAPLELSIDLLILDDANLAAEADSGPTQLTGRLHVRNLDIKAPQEKWPLLGYDNFSFMEYSMDELWADYAKLRPLAGSGKREAFAEALLAMRFGASVMTGFEGEWAGLPEMQNMPGAPAFSRVTSASVGRIECEPYTLTSFGKIINTDQRFTYANGLTVSMKTSSLDSGAFPAALMRSVIAGDTSAMLDPEETLKIMAQGYVAKGLSCTELVFDIPEAGTLEIPDIGADVELGGGKLALRLKAEEIIVPVSTLQALLPQWDMLFKEIRTPAMTFFNDFVVETVPEAEEMVRVNLLWNIGAKNLGSQSMAVTLLGQANKDPNEILPVKRDTLALTNGRLETHDQDFLRLAFATPLWAPVPENPQDSPQETAKARRDFFIAIIRDLALEAPAQLREMLNVGAAFVEQSGSLVITMEPEIPVALISFLNPSVVSFLNIKALHTPPQTEDDAQQQR